MACPRCGADMPDTGVCPACNALPGETGVTLANDFGATLIAPVDPGATLVAGTAASGTDRKSVV